MSRYVRRRQGPQFVITGVQGSMLSRSAVLTRALISELIQCRRVSGAACGELGAKGSDRSDRSGVALPGSGVSREAGARNPRAPAEAVHDDVAFFDFAINGADRYAEFLGRLGKGQVLGLVGRELAHGRLSVVATRSDALSSRTTTVTPAEGLWS